MPPVPPLLPSPAPPPPLQPEPVWLEPVQTYFQCLAGVADDTLLGCSTAAIMDSAACFFAPESERAEKCDITFGPGCLTVSTSWDYYGWGNSAASIDFGGRRFEDKQLAAAPLAAAESASPSASASLMGPSLIYPLNEWVPQLAEVKSDMQTVAALIPFASFGPPVKGAPGIVKDTSVLNHLRAASAAMLNSTGDARGVGAEGTLSLDGDLAFTVNPATGVASVNVNLSAELDVFLGVVADVRVQPIATTLSPPQPFRSLTPLRTP